MKMNTHNKHTNKGFAFKSHTLDYLTFYLKI